MDVTRLMKTRWALGALLSAALAFGACSDDDGSSEPATVVDALAERSDMTTLVAAVNAADLGATLTGDGPFTIFAPTNAAFDALPAGTLDALLADKPALTDVLTYHVVAGAVTADTVVTLSSATTLQGDDVTISVENGAVILNGSSTVTVTDIETGNGVIHIIDAVLLPPEDPQTITDIVVASDDFETLEAAVIAADLATTLSGPGPFTVFAPTDAAFDALPTGTLDALLADKPALTDVLLYHVLSGAVDAATVTGLTEATAENGDPIQIAVTNGEVILNGSVKVTMTDLPASNGIIHVIDAVLLPPEDPQTITDIVVAGDEFDTLEAAVISAELAATLSGPGPFTVFAPTDDAFDKLPMGALDALLADKDALTDVLLYHVVSGSVDASTVVTLDEATAQNDVDITIEVMNGDVILNGEVKVTRTDIAASNGIIHVIDAVLLPPPSIASIVADSANHATLETALGAAGLTSALEADGRMTVFAPTDAAFNALPMGTLDGLLADTAALTDVLLYHVIDGKYLDADVVSETTLTMKNGALAWIDTDGGAFITDAPIAVTNIRARNGIVHVIDAVMVPPPTITEIVVGSDDFDTLETAVTTAGLATTLDEDGPFTVFAPTDNAFAQVPSDDLNALLADTSALANVLLYHVADGVVPAAVAVTLDAALMKNGDEVSIDYQNSELELNDGAMVTSTDIRARNGIIHVIDAVLLPPAGE